MPWYGALNPPREPEEDYLHLRSVVDDTLDIVAEWDRAIFAQGGW